MIHETSIHELFRSTNRLLLGGFALLIAVVVVIGLVANSGRLVAEGAGDSVEVQTRNQARSACITDLRSIEANAYGLESDAIINRLAVLDGTDPATGEPIPTVPLADGRVTPDPDIVEELAAKYTAAGLDARDQRIAAAEKLEQPELDRACGTPVTSKSQVGDGN